jgi:sRNA-binding protein
MVQRIEALSDEVITDIVRRIPFQWLREGEATPILTGLLTRRGLVRRALAGYLEKAP